MPALARASQQSSEVIAIADEAGKGDGRIVGIPDNTLSPLAKSASTLFRKWPDELEARTCWVKQPVHPITSEFRFLAACARSDGNAA